MSTARMYVGNLSMNTTEGALRKALELEGTLVRAVAIAADPVTGRSRGYAFVEMESSFDAQKAIAAWNGRELDGRAILVSDTGGRPERGDRGPKTSFVFERGGRGRRGYR